MRRCTGDEAAGRQEDHTGPDPEYEWALVARAQAGDAEAFGELYDLHLAAVFRRIRRLVGGDTALAEDLTADTFFRALRGIATLRREAASPAAWLQTIARNVVTDHWRSAHTTRCTSVAAVPDQPDGGEGLEVLAIERSDLARRAVMVRGLVRQLPPDQRRCVVLRHVLGLDLAEIAQRMGRSRGAVVALHTRAMHNLRRRAGLDSPGPTG